MDAQLQVPTLTTPPPAHLQTKSQDLLPGVHGAVCSVQCTEGPSCPNQDLGPGVHKAVRGRAQILT